MKIFDHGIIIVLHDVKNISLTVKQADNKTGSFYKAVKIEQNRLADGNEFFVVRE